MSILFLILLIVFFIIHNERFGLAKLIIFLTTLIYYVLSIPILSHYHQAAVIEKWKNYHPVEDSLNVGIVLGGFIEEHSTQKYDVSASFDRLVVGLRLLKEKRINKLILSGGTTSKKSPAESELMLSFIKEFTAFPDSLFILEKQSINTDENAKYCSHLIDSLGLPKTHFLITNYDHLDRALNRFKYYGLNPIALPIDLPKDEKWFNKFPFTWIPNPYVLAYWSKTFRNWLGVQYYSLIN